VTVRGGGGPAPLGRRGPPFLLLKLRLEFVGIIT